MFLSFTVDNKGIKSPKKRHATLFLDSAMLEFTELFRTTHFFHKIVNPRAFWPYIESNATDTFKAQKGSKDIN